MKWLRAILTGALLWILIFIEISVVQIGLNITGLTGQIIHYILLIPLTILAAFIYYKSKDKINGFLLGIVMMVVGLVLDLIITAPLFTGYGFFADIYLWIGMIEAVVIIGIYDLARKK